MNTTLSSISNLVYSKTGITLKNYVAEAESEMYDASTFLLNNYKIKSRTAKTTPKKVGQFVTFWKRAHPSAEIEPFQTTDDFDFFIVSCRSGGYLGQFIFPKSILIDKGILSTSRREGKRAFRVYPSWDTPTSKQAIKTQKWQLHYFYLAGSNGAITQVEALLRNK